MKKKALYIIESLKKKDKLTADLERSICNAKSIDELEIIVSIHRYPENSFIEILDTKFVNFIYLV